MLASLARVMVPVLAAFTLIRFVDLGLRGKLGLLGTFDLYTGMFLLETVLFLAPAVMLLSPRARSDAGNLFRAAMVMILAGSVYRLDAYLVAFRPGERFSYFPSFAEMMVTLGVVALEVILYVVLVRYFPILSAPGVEAPARPVRA
jgi:Ni/Fe-hydrogenase subunit HybB-like protein